MGFIVIEGVVSLDGNPRQIYSAYVAMASACTLLIAVGATYALGQVESAVRMSSAELATTRRIRAAVLVAYAIYGALIPTAQVAKGERFGANSSAVLIFSAALLSAAGGTRYLEVGAISAVWFVVWCACGGAGGFLVNVGVNAEVDPTGETPSLHTLLVLLLCTLLAVSYSSYVGEYSRRRLQLLLYRMYDGGATASATRAANARSSPLPRRACAALPPARAAQAQGAAAHRRAAAQHDARLRRRKAQGGRAGGGQSRR